MDPGEKVPAVDELHREKPGVAVGEELVELDHIRVTDVGEGPKLALESEKCPRIEARHRLQRDDLAPLDVAHSMYDAHASFAEVPLDHEAFGPTKAAEGAEHRA
jgi:hypothetical protein